MKRFKKIFKWIILPILLFIFAHIAVYTYAYLTPKLQIKSANQFTLFDNNNNVFFQGSGSKEWI